MTVSLEHQQRIAELREKSRAGTLTREECKEGIIFLRGARLAMPPSKTSKAKPIINEDDLLSELGI